MFVNIVNLLANSQEMRIGLVGTLGELLEISCLLLGDTVLALQSGHLCASPSLSGLVGVLLGGWLLGRVASDGGVRLLVHGLDSVSLDAKLDVLGELPLESIIVFFSKRPHVVGNVLAEDVISVDLSVELFALGTVAREALHTVGDVKATVNSALHGTEDASAGGGADETHVQVTTECTRAFIIGFDIVLVTVDLVVALVELIQTQLLEQLQYTKNPIRLESSSMIKEISNSGHFNSIGKYKIAYSSRQQQSSAVRSSIVGETSLDSKVRQLMRIGCAQDHVSFDAGVRNLNGKMI
jgi:hypothetical protein